MTKILLLWDKFFLKRHKYFVMRMEPIISLETYLLGVSCHPEKCLEDLRDSTCFASHMSASSSDPRLSSSGNFTYGCLILTLISLVISIVGL